VVDDWSRRTGVMKKKPKCLAHYNTHMHGVDTADQNLAYYNKHMHGVDTADQYLAYYNTHMHGVDTADQYLAYYPFIRKTVKWPMKVFFCLLQCALFNSYVLFTKSNPNSHKSFLYYLLDVRENLTQEKMYQHHHHHHHHHQTTSPKTRAERLHQLHSNEPRKVTHLAGLMEN
jgi:hypothetical protein